jgi:hypothetical protein
MREQLWFVMRMGISPEKELLGKSRNSRLESCDNSGGRTPLKLLDVRLRNIREGPIIPNQEAISPKNLLFPRSKLMSVLHVSITDGKTP